MLLFWKETKTQKNQLRMIFYSVFCGFYGLEFLSRPWFVINSAGLHNLLESLNVFFNFYANDTQIHMTVDNSPESQEKLTYIWSCKTMVESIKTKTKTEILVVGTAYWKNIFSEPYSFSLNGAETHPRKFEA